MNIFKAIIMSIFFTITITGCTVLLNPQAKIIVSQGSFELENNSGLVDFGKVEVNNSKTIILKIQNDGKKALKLTGLPIIDIRGVNKDSFTLTSQPETLLKEGDWTTIQLKFSPTQSNFYEAEVVIANNDPDDNPFTFVVKGRGVIIDIEVWQNSTPILNDTGLYDFGEIYLGNTTASAIFKIQNIGTKRLDLTGTSKLFILQGQGMSSFIIDESMTKKSLEPNETTTFRVSFNPQSGGVKTAKVIFENSDPDENPYNFTVRGICLDPEIQVLDPDDKDIPNNTGEYVFPDNHLSNSRLYTFTIKNIGTTTLDLLGSPIIEISGSIANAFTIHKQPDNLVTTSSNTTFIIQFKPTAPIIYSANVTFKNNDEDENPFVFTIRGLGYETKFDFNGDGFDDVIISAYSRNNYSSDIDFAYLFLGGNDYKRSVQCNEADTVFTIHTTYKNIDPIVAAAGDINGDGYDDILISNHSWNYTSTNRGQVLIYFGSANPPSSFKYTEADVLIKPTKNLDLFGWRLSSVGDFNNDGLDDFMVGAPICDNSSAGSAFLFFGRQSWDSKLSSSKADMAIIGTIENGNFGYSISGAGDFNGDGFDDVIIGAPHLYYHSDKLYPGKAYIFFGESDPPKSKFDINADVVLTGEKDSDIFGASVSKAGNINNDGYDDVIIGAPHAANGSRREGSAYVFFGRPNPPASISPLNANIKIIGNNRDSRFGICVSNAGDVNDDGYEDMIIAENCNNTDILPKNGNVYIFYGAPNPRKLMELRNANVQIDAEKSFFSYQKTVSCAGDFNGDRIDDVFFTSELEVNIFFGRTPFNGFFELMDSDIEILSTNSIINIGRSISGGN